MAMGPLDNPQRPMEADAAGTGSGNGKGQIAQSTRQNTETNAETGEDAWDEKRLEEAMARLKDMHIQLRNLRTTIPRLLAPLTTKQPSPEALFREFSKSASTATQEVQQFRKLMAQEETGKVLEHARKSRSENPNDIKPWKATDHPDWLTRDE
ncbi:Uncharacterized protein BP5553_06918 [Venustampulla echinocandica]|uniref:Uncharacterized protein n=1 Tax=Venustampulla echinocandica TaxID=2656787 RepID=A0A370TI10_9HELO|nr:Uncharacterized protein BP5553_06918 [Venustampulla echinocandica]RDL34987.1 Uncharacterized protein BP5553_06918 [Venustampulla echinocandica]